MDYFDLYKLNNGDLSKAFKDTKVKFCIISFSTDWLYPTQESKKIVIALNSIGAQVSFVNIITNNGHDSFLVEEPEFFQTLKATSSASLVIRAEWKRSLLVFLSQYHWANLLIKSLYSRSKRVN